MLATKIFKLCKNNVTFLKTARYFSGKLYEPDYLESMKPKVPIYEEVNVQLKGYDYSVLENYQKYVHNLSKNIDINVEECWPLPPQSMQIVTYKPNSEVVNSQYNLKIYQRTVQITDVSSMQLAVLIRALEASVPAGVTIDIEKHEDHHEEIRYVPDKELLTLKQELEGMGGARKK